MAERAVTVDEQATDQSEALTKEIEKYRNVAERAINAGQKLVDQNENMMKEIEKLTGQPTQN